VGALVAAVGVALTLAASSAQAGSSDPAPAHRAVRHTRHYVVRPGDTLWGIASRIAGPGADPRAELDALVRANHVGGTLAVGTRLVIPS
jgi:Tfp pilus assembly protein FimV